MKKIPLLILFVYGGTASAQTDSLHEPHAFVGASYRLPSDGGSGSWGASVDFGRVFGGNALIAGQFSYLVRTSVGSYNYNGGSGSADQLGLSIMALARGKWINLGPHAGIVYGQTPRDGTNFYMKNSSSVSVNYGGVLKIAFAGIPQSSLLSVDYGVQTGWGVGLTFPIQ